MPVIVGTSLEFTETPGGNAVVGVATPSRGATDVSVIRQRQAPGGFNPRHTHDREEVVAVVTGTLTVTMNDESHSLGPSDTIIIPAETIHQFTNTGGEPAEWMLIAPAGIRFFGETGEEAKPAWAQ